MKFKRLKELKENGINVPEFFLYENDLEKIQNFKSEKIILRSSYKKEDSEKKSLAGIFSSIGNIDKNNLENIKNNINLIKKDAFKKIENIGGKKQDFEIIIQEYIKTDFGGVIFVENEKILIELNFGAGAEKVVNGNVKGTLFFYKKFKLKSGKKIINKKIENKILEIIKRIKKNYNFDLDIEFGIKNNKIFIFQVRPITKKVLENFYLLDNSNIGENFTGTTTKLTASFVKNLYSKVYKSVAYNSGLSYEKISKIEHIFDDLIVYKNKKIYYNIISWYKFLLLFPGDNKKAFDVMIGAKNNLSFLYLDDIYDFKPNFLFKIKYIFILISKFFTFDSKIKKLENYLENFYKDFEKINLEKKSLNDLYLLYKQFEQNLSYLWYITIDNDFMIMKFGKNLDLGTINGLASAKQIYFLQDVANGKKTKEEYLEKYGHRFGDELKLEKPDITEKLEDFEKILNKIKNNLSTESFNPLNNKDIKYFNPLEKNNFLSKYIKNRENFRLYRSKNFSVARKIFLYIGEKFVKEKILENKQEIFDLEINQIFDKILENNRIASKNNDKILIGNKFEGKIYVMEEFHIPDEKIEIIVAKNFDPGWIVLLSGIKGIIIENGNMLSHVSIICRELNIPLLIGVKDATKNYKTGDYLKINSDGKILGKNT